MSNFVAMEKFLPFGQTSSHQVDSRSTTDQDEEVLSEGVDDVTGKVREALEQALADGIDDPHDLQQRMRRVVGRWVNATHRRRPMIVPVVVEA